MRIWKQELQITDTQFITVPHKAVMLDAQFQGDSILCLWFLCNPDKPPSERKIAIYGTGNPVPENPGKHISTVQDGILVWHVFDATEEQETGR